MADSKRDVLDMAQQSMLAWEDIEIGAEPEARATWLSTQAHLRLHLAAVLDQRRGVVAGERTATALERIATALESLVASVADAAASDMTPHDLGE